METTVRYSDKLMVRCQPGMMSVLNEGARRHGTKQSEFVRQIIRDGLMARGIDPNLAAEKQRYRK